MLNKLARRNQNVKLRVSIFIFIMRTDTIKPLLKKECVIMGILIGSTAAVIAGIALLFFIIKKLDK